MRTSTSKQADDTSTRLGWLIERADYLALQVRPDKKDNLPNKNCQNKYYSTPFFTIQARPTTNTEDKLDWRVGLTTSKRVGNAVVRNRARRRLRDLARRELPHLMQPGYDLVLIGRTPAAVAPYPVLVAQLTVALEKLKLDKLRLQRKAGA